MRLLVLAVLVAALALTGAAKVGHAASSNGVAVTDWHVLNDISSTVAGQPSPGGNIGYDLTVSNQGTSTANHLVLTESIGAGGSTVLVQSTPNVCTGGTTLTCTIKQFPAGSMLHVVVLFKTPNPPGSSTVTNTIVGSFDPQTTGPPNSRKSDTFGPCESGLDLNCTTTNGVDTVTRQYAGLTSTGGVDPSFRQSLLLPFDKHGQGNLTVNGMGGQSASVTMPTALTINNFLNGKDFVGTTLETSSNVTPPSGCPSCQPFLEHTTIPLAATFTTTGPFLDASGSDPYTWTFTIPIPNNFKPTALYHTDDLGNNPFFVQLCSVTPVTSSPGICMTGNPTVDKKTNPNTATYSGIGVVNGHGWGG
jgi:uncharacterized repeat protein (TIGR01451 family)